MLLELHEVCTGYGMVQVLNGLSLHVEEGKLVTIVGPNGAGKTTTLRTICGLLPVTKGEILFAGERIDNLKSDKIVKMGIAHCPEGRQIWPNMTVMENLELGAFIHRSGVKADIDRMFTLFPILKERKNQHAGSLSGGEQQSLAVARALMAKPDMIMLDEPSTGLAPLVIKSIFEIIKNVRDTGTTVLLVEQNAKMALGIADRGYVLKNGRIVMEDTGKNLLTNDDVRKAYLGEKQ